MMSPIAKAIRLTTATAIPIHRPNPRIVENASDVRPGTEVPYCPTASEFVELNRIGGSGTSIHNDANAATNFPTISTVAVAT